MQSKMDSLMDQPFPDEEVIYGWSLLVRIHMGGNDGADIWEYEELVKAWPGLITYIENPQPVWEFPVFSQMGQPFDLVGRWNASGYLTSVRDMTMEERGRVLCLSTRPDWRNHMGWVLRVNPGQWHWLQDLIDTHRA